MLTPETQQSFQQLAAWLVDQRGDTPCPVIGIQGAQGSGKSTLARYLVEHLGQQHGLRIGLLSLDDCYLGRDERRRLARDIHPLLITRGVPGTHDVMLGRRLLKAMRAPGTRRLLLPVFDKAADDRAAHWLDIEGPFDMVLFEGWCVGLPAQNEAELVLPINALEREEDTDGRWRRYVNAQLAGPYAKWFSMINTLVSLQIPHFGMVRQWRGEQEHDTAGQAGADRQGLMDDAALARFIAHYERLTRHALTVMPRRADVLLALDESHAVRGLQWPGSG